MKNTNISPHIAYCPGRVNAGLSRLRRTLGACLAVAALVAPVATMARCGAPSPVDQQVLASPPPASPIADAQVPCGPVKIAVLADQTPSATWTRTPQLHPSDFAPLIDLVVRCGGEIGVTPILDRHDFSTMVRLPVDPLVPPIAPRKDQNPFRFNLAETAYKRAMGEFHERVARRQDQVSRRVDEFRNGLGQLLEHHRTVHASAVCDGLSRADLFLSEPLANWWREPHLYLVSVSDGLDTYRKSPCPPVSSGASLLVVNGTGSVGALLGVHPLRFESFQAAVKYIFAKEVK